MGKLIRNRIEYTGGGGSGGHTIVDDAGTDLTQRTNLQFKGAYSDDNSTDDTTEVNVVREMTKAEFDLLSADEKVGFINITDITSGSDDRFQPVIYSEEEREIGVWIDGKPLYQKTIVLENVTITTSGYNYDITSLSIDSLIEIPSGFITLPSGTDTLRTIPFNLLGSYSFAITAGRTFITFSRATGDLPTTSVVVTLRYTKTTDTAGSGQWTPQGVPTHHYSTDEQVVGTWIDGNTLYEKTYVFETDIVMNSNTWVDTPIPNTNFLKIISFEGMNNSGTNLGFIGVNRDAGSGYIQLLNTRNIATPCRVLTLRYTKTS